MKKSPHYKTGRVKVGIRCRPPFQEEIEIFTKQDSDFISIVDTIPESTEANQVSTLGKVSLTTISGKQRDFLFDYVFPPDCQQDQVYDRIARPVVSDVLKGFNGTIFAYGQTGTGKTYTMGILEFVHNEHAGIIPRSIYQIFEYVEAQLDSVEITISITFLQLYREMIQDLLLPAASSSGIAVTHVNEDNLAIREDPHRGFYVEGLQEFTVRSYREAEALINLGLENRAIAPTLMNSTSSRSHTVLTLNLEQRTSSNPSSKAAKNVGNYSKTLRSKLLMVDLAGSERVRRTVSKGTRLSEAKSINTSLSALGNVIAALASANSVTHIPYRDSKLTRLLQDSLGGTASTALIATVGPAPVNYGETLSTLLFASRCMAVKSTPVQHEEVDYAEMCANLQARLSSIETNVMNKLQQQQDHYEKIIHDLQSQMQSNHPTSNHSNLSYHLKSNEEFESNTINLLKHLEDIRRKNPLLFYDKDGNVVNSNENPHTPSWLCHELTNESPDGELSALFAYCFEIIADMSHGLTKCIHNNAEIQLEMKQQRLEEIALEERKQRERDLELKRMLDNDPLNQVTATGQRDAPNVVESHLAPLNKVEAMVKVDNQYPSNNGPLPRSDGELHDDVAKLESIIPLDQRTSIYDYDSVNDLAAALLNMHKAVSNNLHVVEVSMLRKDGHFKKIKDELADQLVEKRKREEEVVNWSYILKYLLKTGSKLRKQLNKEKKLQANTLLALQRATTSSAPTPMDMVKQHLFESKQKQSTLTTPQANPTDLEPRPIGISFRDSGISEIIQDRKSDGLNHDSNVGTKLGARLAFTKQAISQNLEHDKVMDDAEDSEIQSNGGKSMSDDDHPDIKRPVNHDSIKPLKTPNHSLGPGSITNTSYAGSATIDDDLFADFSVDDSEYSTTSYHPSQPPLHHAPINTLVSNLKDPSNQSNPPNIKGRQPMSEKITSEPQVVPTKSLGNPSLAHSGSISSLSTNSRTVTSFAGKNPDTFHFPPDSKANRFMSMQLTQRGTSKSPLKNISSNKLESQTIPVAKVNSRSTTPQLIRSRHHHDIEEEGVKEANEPSHFAREVVEELGVKGPQADIAMSIIDKVSKITPAQLKKLDSETRAQILQIRRDLRISSDDLLDNPPQRSSNEIRNDLVPSSQRSRSKSPNLGANLGRIDQKPLRSNTPTSLPINNRNKIDTNYVMMNKIRSSSPAMSTSSSISQLTSPTPSINGTTSNRFRYNSNNMSLDNKRPYNFQNDTNGMQFNAKFIEQAPVPSGPMSHFKVDDQMMGSVSSDPNHSITSRSTSRSRNANRYNIPTNTSSHSQSQSQSQGSRRDSKDTKFFNDNDHDTEYSQLDEIESNRRKLP